MKPAILVGVLAGLLAATLLYTLRGFFPAHAVLSGAAIAVLVYSLITTYRRLGSTYRRR